jgi:hypothetical protein
MGNRGSYLVAGQSLAAGDYLASPNGQYCAVMQDDGNFVLYWGCPPDKLIGAMWSSDTVYTSKTVDQSLSMQKDGNLVLYRDGKPVWASNTAGKSGNLFARMQDDGNFVLYQGTPDQSGASYWDTTTWQLSFWVKNQAAYVSAATLSSGGGTGDFDSPQCKTLTGKISRTATLSFGVVGLETNFFNKLDLGALRSKRFEMTGLLGSPGVQMQTGHGSF